MVFDWRHKYGFPRGDGGVGGREYGNEWQVTKVMVNQKPGIILVFGLFFLVIENRWY